MPASTSITVTPDDLHVTAQQYRSAANDILGLLGSLDANASNLTSGWTGRSVASFHKLWDRWHKELYDLAQAMHTIADTLDKSAANYNQTNINAMPKPRGVQ